VSVLSQQTVLQDFHAKILCDNLQALVTDTASDFVSKLAADCTPDVFPQSRKIRRPKQPKPHKATSQKPC
jgi:hypothetical protein